MNDWMNLSVCLSVGLSVCLSVCLLVCVCLSGRPVYLIAVWAFLFVWSLSCCTSRSTGVGVDVSRSLASLLPVVRLLGVSRPKCLQWWSFGRAGFRGNPRLKSVAQMQCRICVD